MTETFTGWHWSRGTRLNNDGRRILPVGRWQRARLAADEEPTLCECGMHCSPTALESLRYAPGLYVARVEVRGQLDRGDDKVAGRERRDTTRRIDAREIILAWLRECVVPLAANAKAYAADYAANAAAHAAAHAANTAVYAVSAARCAADAADVAGGARNAAVAEMNADLERRLDAAFAAAE